VAGSVTSNGADSAPTPAAAAFCRWCGKSAGTPGCEGGACRRPLDPPRCCPTCGRRLRVVVIPTGVTATCRDHGDVPT
jgi:hypothetical protein